MSAHVSWDEQFDVKSVRSARAAASVKFAIVCGFSGCPGHELLYGRFES